MNFSYDLQQSNTVKYYLFKFNPFQMDGSLNILLCLMPDYSTCQCETSCHERVNTLTLFQQIKPFNMLLYLTPDNFTCQCENLISKIMTWSSMQIQSVDVQVSSFISFWMENCIVKLFMSKEKVKCWKWELQLMYSYLFKVIKHIR